MKKLMVLFLALSVLPACAHQTVHEACSEKETVSHYASYDQCYQEVTAERERKLERRRAVAAAFSNRRSSSQVCNTQYGGGMANTQCF